MVPRYSRDYSLIVDFALTPEQRQLQQKCLELAADFATRAAAHDRVARNISVPETNKLFAAARRHDQSS